MRATDLLRYSGGAVRRHRLRTFLSILGVGIGVAAVILLTGLGEGARRYVVGEFASLGSNLLIIVPGKTETAGLAPLISTAPHDLTRQDAEALPVRVAAVRRVAPLIVGTAAARAGERSREVTLVGTTREMLAIRHLKMSIGRFLPAATPDAAVCVLGARVQRELFPGENPLGQLLRIGDWRFRVIGVILGRIVGMVEAAAVEEKAARAGAAANVANGVRAVAKFGTHLGQIFRATFDVPVGRAES